MDGYSIYRDANNKFVGHVYIAERGEYMNVKRRSLEAKTNEKYSIGFSYDGRKIRQRAFNTYDEQEVIGTIGNTAKDTYMVLGANPVSKKASSEYFTGSIFSVRIYNRALTDEENSTNYLNDREKIEI